MQEKKVLLIGHPVGHSISPRFQQAAFDHLQLAVRYEACDTQESRLSERVNVLRNDQFLGANVTVPHKQNVLPLVDEASGEAAAVGAANCLVNAGGRLIAHNTDVSGFRRALRDAGHFDARGRRAVVLGAGGAARAIVVALCFNGVSEVMVLNRSVDRARRLVEELSVPAEIRLQSGSLDSDGGAAVAACDLLVNCTSLGMSGSELEGLSPLPDAVSLSAATMVVDIVANPVWTPLLQQARANGCPTLGGLAMLVHQGALAFSLWTGRAAPTEVMMRAARVAMGVK